MDDNKKIAVNTVVLYVKLIINIITGFIISRVALKALGADDYGLYNVVGGIVGMLNVVGASMVATSYRYMAVEIGKGKTGNPNKVYNTIFVIHLVLAILLLLIGESVGVFYVKHYLNVDAAKIPDALFVLHLSLLTTAFAVITVPTNGLIVAKEKFFFTSCVDSLSAIAKLLFVLVLVYIDGNRLRLYASSLAVVQFASPVTYQIYCRVKCRDIVKWSFNKNYNNYKDVFGFAWWMLVGALACVGRIQGAAMIINFFFGTLLNAAFGLASQVSHAVSAFTSTLRQAFIPQIMKAQSAGNEKRSLDLVYATSRYSYLCMNIIAIPLLLSMDNVLKIWLGNPPEYTKLFVIFMLVNGMVSNLGAGFDASIQATGKVRKNQIGYCIINLSLLPIIFFLYKLGMPPFINVITMVLLTIATLIFQIYIMGELTAFNLKHYIKLTIIPSFCATALSIVPLFPLKFLFNNSLIATVCFFPIAALWTCFSIFLLGITPYERQTVTHVIKNKFSK